MLDIRLNKLISDAGVCSRREADLFIQTERVTVNGKLPHVGQRVTAEDVVLVDGDPLNVQKYIDRQEKERKEAMPSVNEKEKGQTAKPEKTGPAREKYGKYNKYAAARKAMKAGGRKPKAGKLSERMDALRDSLLAGDGKSSGKWSKGKRITFVNPKSAALRKASRNNPLNKKQHRKHSGK